MRDRLPLNDLVSHLNSSGEALETLLGDTRVLARLTSIEVDHLAAALESVMHAWSCLEYVGGIGPAVPGVESATDSSAPVEALSPADVLVN